MNNLAQIDLGQRQFDKARAKLKQAIDWQRKALTAVPTHPVYRQYLANHLTNLITAAEALNLADEADQARREIADLAARDPIKAELDARLSAVLKGHPPKDNSDRLVLAYRAYEKALHASSARLFAEALANDPKLADDRGAVNRYNAACAAALAGSAHGKDNPSPDLAARNKLRAQALNWLKDELAAWAKFLEGGTTEMKAKIAPSLQHWKIDTDLAGIRDEKELAKLPEAERATFKQLWKDVEQVLTKATGGNGVRSDIGKIGKLDALFRHAKNSESGSGWYGFPRFESWRGADAVVREARGLPSVRAGAARNG